MHEHKKVKIDKNVKQGGQKLVKVGMLPMTTGEEGGEGRLGCPRRKG